MAAASSFLSLFPRSSPPSELPARFSSHLQRKLSLIPRAAIPSSNPSSPVTVEPLPQIELEFFGPKPRPDGAYPVERATAISGEKLLRNIMLDNKIELYAAYGKVMNCGGGGSCGTCIVEILDGEELLNERTNTEKRYLKNKPESWRLACQTIVGNKENSGKFLRSGCCSKNSPEEKVILDRAPDF
ncbi:photosynthetic NDH subunit of subcomplex B 3, chloroplastic-like isoform X2 [Zingiber officinale]|uniref:photosynthetic NDH subunit of subcomplex B 3, chloroplastic-like isoform X2 n=1 Tax=Zingiber officinale TaxID=94328 RepID=UPI001C4AB684|nr:photosynthetic NDH subunit of subcomplex B 3, chloroplastic-like isoform X2 [Zingiber officinale]